MRNKDLSGTEQGLYETNTDAQIIRKYRGRVDFHFLADTARKVNYIRQLDLSGFDNIRFVFTTFCTHGFQKGVWTVMKKREGWAGAFLALIRFEY